MPRRKQGAVDVLTLQIEQKASNAEQDALLSAYRMQEIKRNIKIFFLIVFKMIWSDLHVRILDQKMKLNGGIGIDEKVSINSDWII